MVIFHSYVSLPEGIVGYKPDKPVSYGGFFMTSNS